PGRRRAGGRPCASEVRRAAAARFVAIVYPSVRPSRLLSQRALNHKARRGASLRCHSFETASNPLPRRERGPGALRRVRVDMMVDATAIQTEFRRDAQLIEPIVVRPVAFVAEVEDARSVQVERGVVFPMVIDGRWTDVAVDAVDRLVLSSARSHL